MPFVCTYISVGYIYGRNFWIKYSTENFSKMVEPVQNPLDGF